MLNEKIKHQVKTKHYTKIPDKMHKSGLLIAFADSKC